MRGSDKRNNAGMQMKCMKDSKGRMGNDILAMSDTEVFLLNEYSIELNLWKKNEKLLNV